LEAQQLQEMISANLKMFLFFILNFKFHCIVPGKMRK
jgi:hypothetical protein